MKQPDSGRVPDNWWKAFFESPDSLRLAFFPTQEITAYQVEGLHELLSAWKPTRVLDLCCGHGRHMVPLAALGYSVVGADVSQLMVGRARQAAKAARVRAPVLRADARMMPFADGSLDAVLCLFNSFGYLPTDGQNKRVLREVRRCLAPDGRFLLDTRNREFQLSHLPFSEVVPMEAGAIWLECDLNESGDRLVSVFRCAGTGRTLHTASIRAYHLYELGDMFDEAGLEIESIHGGYDWRPFEAESRELLIVASRQ